MYETYYQLKTKPFTLLPDPEFLYLGAKHKTALSLLEYGLANGSAFIIITGEPGTGKTTLLNQLLDETRHPWTIGVLSNTHSGFGGLLPWIATAFDMHAAGKRETEVFQDFSRFLERERSAGRRVLLIVDEAQNIGATMLEELRLLSNLNDGRRRSLQIVLSGQLGLRAFLKGPGMVQLAQRIGVEYVLDALTEDETIAYIAHRLQVSGRTAPLFTTAAGRSVFRLSGGIPRVINQLCDHALVYGVATQAVFIRARVVLDAAAARDRHAMFPFKVAPQSIEISTKEAEEEQAQVRTFQAPNIVVNGMVGPPDRADMQDPASLYDEAMALKESGNFEQAIKLFDRLAGEETWGLRALVKKGLCLKAMGRFEEAIGTLQIAIRRGPTTGKDRLALDYLLGRTLEDAGKPTEAADVYRQIWQEGVPYRDVEIRLDRLSEFSSNGQSAAPAPSSWWTGLFKGYTRVFHDKRTQRFPTFK
jgi:type II secretory pathway predicted ATPase ExeA